MIALPPWVARLRLWLISAIVLLIVVVLAGRMSVSSEDVAVAPQPLPVAVFEAQYQDTYEERRLFPGRIKAAQVSDVGFQISGEVAEVFVQIGDQVEKGARLAALDPKRIDLRKDEAKAQLAEARAVAQRARQTRDRVAQLLGEGFATTQELDDADAEARASQERAVFFERALARISEDAGDALLTSPFDGFVVERYVDGGATVNVGQPIVRLNQKANFEAEISVPSDLAQSLSPRDGVNLQVGEDAIPAVVEGVGDDVDPRTQSRMVLLSIDGDQPVFPGALVRLSLNRQRQGRGVWVPITALQESYRGLWSVYVVDGQDDIGLIRRRDIEIISLSDEKAFVTGTIETGDRVVKTSPFRFVPGQEVVVTQDGLNAEVLSTLPSVASVQTKAASR